MIFDVLANCEMYYGVNENLQKAFNFIKKARSENLPAGRYEIDGKELYAMVQKYVTSNGGECIFEGHRKYIDIQYIVSGIEAIEAMDISKAKVTSEYNAQDDAALYANSDNVIKSVLEAGEFGIFFPNDIHKPGITVGDAPASVKKIIVKVKCAE